LWCKHVLSCHFLYLFLDHARIDNTSSTLWCWVMVVVIIMRFLYFSFQ
jgi:hypothetical protein